MEPKKIYRPEYIRAVDDILRLPSGPRRWRASVALYLNLNPADDDGFTAKQQYRIIAKQNETTRLMQDNKFASNQSESMRLGLDAPPWFMTVIEAFDRMSFDAHNPDCKKNLRKLIKEFREFKIMAVI